MATVGVVGLNYWGPNLARNFDDLADLTWLCDLDERHLAPSSRALPERAGDDEPTTTCSPTTRSTPS